MAQDTYHKQKTAPESAVLVGYTLSFLPMLVGLGLFLLRFCTLSLGFLLVLLPFRLLALGFLLMFLRFL